MSVSLMRMYTFLKDSDYLWLLTQCPVHSRRKVKSLLNEVDGE